MKEPVKMLTTCLAVMLLLTGCGNQIPDMTEEQVQMVGEYAAITLLKYDADHRSRLVDASVIEEHDAKEKALQEQMAQKESASQTEGMMKPVEDTPTIDITQNPEVGSEIGLEEFYDLPMGMSVSYQGEEVRDAYSGDASADAFSLEATPGKKLLILKFVIDNQSGSDQSIDLFSKTAVYRVTVNETYSRGVLTTMLTDDMSTYIGTIPSGESRNVVLLMEIDKNMEGAITSISLNFKNELKTGTIRLK